MPQAEVLSQVKESLGFTGSKILEGEEVYQLQFPPNLRKSPGILPSIADAEGPNLEDVAEVGEVIS